MGVNGYVQDSPHRFPRHAHEAVRARNRKNPLEPSRRILQVLQHLTAHDQFGRIGRFELVDASLEELDAWRRDVAPRNLEDRIGKIESSDLRARRLDECSRHIPLSAADLQDRTRSNRGRESGDRRVETLEQPLREWISGTVFMRARPKYDAVFNEHGRASPSAGFPSISSLNVVPRHELDKETVP